MKEDDIQEIIFKCRAGCFHFLEFTWVNDKDVAEEPFMVTITAGGKSFIHRIKAAWQALRGSRYHACEEICLYKEDLIKLKEWVNEILKDNK